MTLFLTVYFFFGGGILVGGCKSFYGGCKSFYGGGKFLGGAHPPAPPQKIRPCFKLFLGEHVLGLPCPG